MKKLIAIAVVFALAAGGVFAADLGVEVFGGVRLFEGSNYWSTGDLTDDQVAFFGIPAWTNVNKDMKMGSSAAMHRLRIEGSGEAGDGNFGAWIRVQTDNIWGQAWWKPIDMFKLAIGGNPDGLYGKEGYSGWMFYQMPCEIGIANNGNTWGGGYGYYDAKFRNAFYGGFGADHLLLSITPVEMFTLNVVLPYFERSSEGGLLGIDTDDDDVDDMWAWGPASEVKDVFKHMMIQADVNMDFGNIALTLELLDNVDPDKIGAKMYLYFGLTSIDNLSLDVGIGYKFPQTTADKTKINSPFNVGVAAQYDVNDSFGLRARVLAQFAGNKKPDGGDAIKDPFALLLDLNPYYAINDSLKAFFSVGLGMTKPDGEGDAGKAVVGWYINPYLQVGAQWGPTFYAGIRFWSDGSDTWDMEGDKKGKTMNFAVPIGLILSF